MRYLFVFYYNQNLARGALKQSQVEDVEIIPVLKGEKNPAPEILAKVAGSKAACSGINKEYRKALKKVLTLEYEGKEFRAEDQRLKEWLVPTTHIVQQYPKPSDAFRAEAATVPHLILMPGCLDRADELSVTRWQFAQDASKLLAKLARGEEAEDPHKWRELHGAAYARNGKVTYKYELEYGDKKFSDKNIDVHLKQGNNTYEENSARVYYHRCDVGDGVSLILVFYVGPHPKDGHYESKHQMVALGNLE